MLPTSSSATVLKPAIATAVLPQPSPSPSRPPPLPSRYSRIGSSANDTTYLIISGGTGANAIASAFGPSPAFVLPVSDDGGSSAEILRCFGGPSIGDIRSRLTRLIPLPEVSSSKEDKEREAIYNLMSFRFPAHAHEKVLKDLWSEIVEGRSGIWAGIGEDRKECIRAFLVHFQTLSLRRAHKRFSLRNFSIGNGFLTGARDLFGSLPSAIFLFKSIANVDSNVQVIPVINTNQTVTIAAQLANGAKLIGQCNISHPAPAVPMGTVDVHSSASALPPLPTNQTGARQSGRGHLRRDSRTFPTADVPTPLDRSPAGIPWSVDEDHAVEEPGNISYTKGEKEEPLEARIDRLFYINLYGQEIFPDPNPEFIESISQRDVLVYSCGSLWTSIAPCLTLRKVSAAIANSPTLRARVLLLNSSNDRETPDYLASDYVATILGMLHWYAEGGQLGGKGDVSRLVSHVVYLEGALVEVDTQVIEEMGIQLVHVPATIHGFETGTTPMFTPEAVQWAMAQILS